MGTVLKNRFKPQLQRLTVLHFTRELILLYVLSLLVVYFLSHDHISFAGIALLLLILFLGIGLIYYRKRARELAAIEAIIRGIRTRQYESSEDLKLPGMLHEVEAEIREMLEQQQSDIEYLKKLERMRTEFLGNVSHELKTPIFAVQGFIETLLNGAIYDPKVNLSFLEKANFHANNLSALVNDLIDISMVETGEMRMSFRYFNINLYLDDLVEEFRPLAEEKGLQLEFIPTEKKLQLFGDKNKLRQVIRNLIQNAIKYSEQGTISVIVEELPRSGKIIVRDTGIGLAEEDIPRVFERFFRVDKARSRAVGGTGLGLAIVKHIVEAHGARVEVKSQLGVGSEFSFELKK